MKDIPKDQNDVLPDGMDSSRTPEPQIPQTSPVALEESEQIRRINAIPVDGGALLMHTRMALAQDGLAVLQKAAAQVDEKLHTNVPFLPAAQEPVLIATAGQPQVLIEDFHRRKLAINDAFLGWSDRVLCEGAPMEELPAMHWRFCNLDEATQLFSNMRPKDWGKKNQEAAVTGVTLQSAIHTSPQFFYFIGGRMKKDYNTSGHYNVADVHIADIPSEYSMLRFLLENQILPKGVHMENSHLLELADLLQQKRVELLETSEGVQLLPSQDFSEQLQHGEIETLGGVTLTDEAVEALISKIGCPDSVLQIFTDDLLSWDKQRADITEYDHMQLEDPNRGSWELWDMDTSHCKMAKIGRTLYARDPRIDVQDGGIIGIDFGTKSTVVVCQNDTDRIHPVRVGVGCFDKEARSIDYENPTVMEFIDINHFLEAYRSNPGRPRTRWSDLTISHTAFDDWTSNSRTEFYFSFFGELKQWAGDPGRRVHIRDQRRAEVSLPPYLELKEGDLDPIELYAYYIGLYINNMHTNRIYLEYLLAFPVTYRQAVRRHVLDSFRRGLSRSLPDTVLRDPACMERFSVEQGAGEPAAYAVCALQEYQITPKRGERIFYGVFDFGGGTADFDFGVWRKADGPKERRYRYVIEHFGDNGDPYLGGENLLELLAYYVFRDNREKLRETGITFTLPPEQERFPGSEMLIADSQEAQTNTRQLMEELRPLWERTPDYADRYAQGVIKVRLFKKNGRETAGFELKVDADALEDVLRERIGRGVDAFFDALIDAFTDALLEETECSREFHLFLAGNSSKSELFKEIFQEKAILCCEELQQKLHEDRQKEMQQECSISFKIYPPLGTLEADQLMREMEIDIPDEDSYERPTGKTGVAIGLIQCRRGSKIKVDEERVADTEIRFRYWLGDDQDGYFSSFISRSTPYHRWIPYVDASEPYFEFYFTAAPSADLESKLKLTDPGIKKRRLTIPRQAVSEDWTIYIRVISPNEVEYAVAENEKAVNAGEYIWGPQKDILRL